MSSTDAPAQAQTTPPRRRAPALLVVGAVEAAAGLEARELRVVQAARVEQPFEGLAEAQPLAGGLQLHRHAVDEVDLAHRPGVGVLEARAEVGLGRVDHARGEGRPADQPRADDAAAVRQVVDGRQRRLRRELPGLQRQQPAARQHVHAVQRLHDRLQLRAVRQVAAEPARVQARDLQFADGPHRGRARLVAQDRELAEHLPRQQLGQVGLDAGGVMAADARTALQHQVQPVGRVALPEHDRAGGEGLDAVALGAAELAQHALAQAAGTQLVVLACGGAQLLRERAAGLEDRQQAVARQHQQPAVRQRAHGGVAPCAAAGQQRLLAEVGPGSSRASTISEPSKDRPSTCTEPLATKNMRSPASPSRTMACPGTALASVMPAASRCQRVGRQAVERRHAPQDGERVVGGHRRLARYASSSGVELRPSAALR